MNNEPKESVEILKKPLYQRILDGFHSLRSWIVVRLAYYSLRFYGLEGFTIKNVKDGNYETEHKPLNLSNAGDLDNLLSISKEILDNAHDRRGTITAKCKTLLTLSSLLLGLVGILLPKSIAFNSTWITGIYFFAILALLNTVTLLLIFFDVGHESEISLVQEDINNDTNKFKEKIINEYLHCQAYTNARTDYLVDIYKSTRFFFMTAFTIVVFLFSIQIMMSPPQDQVDKIIHRLRSNPKLIRLLRGPKGEKGEKGLQGIKGVQGKTGERGQKGEPGQDASIDEGKLIELLLNDSRLKSLENLVPDTDK